MGFLDALTQLGAKLQGAATSLLTEAAKQLPGAAQRGWRWARSNYSDASIGREILLWPFLRRLRSRKSWQFPEFGPLRESVPDDEERLPEDTAPAFDEDDLESPFGMTGDLDSDNLEYSRDEQRLLEVLLRNPDVLGHLIQREKSRGNPLFS